MVTPDRREGDRGATARDRGQIILVGALVVSTVIVGVTLFLNATLFVENAAPSTSVAQLEEARQFDGGTRQTMLELVHRVNVRERVRDRAALKTAVTRQTEAYGRLLGTIHTVSGSATINVTFNAASSDYGTRVVQAEDDGFTEPGGGAVFWDPIPATGPAIGWFVADVNVSATATSPMEITVTNGSSSIEFEIEREDGNLTVRSDPSFGSPVEVTCSPSFNRVLVDLYRGTVQGNCESAGTFVGIDRLDPPHALDIDRGDRLVGEYEFIVDTTAGGVSGTVLPCQTTPDEACRTPAVWTANVSTAYVGSTTSYRNTYNISIYGDT